MPAEVEHVHMEDPDEEMNWGTHLTQEHGEDRTFIQQLSSTGNTREVNDRLSDYHDHVHGWDEGDES